MKIIDLTNQYEELYFVCLEDWSEEIKEGADHKKIWYEKMKGKGLRVKLAVDDNEQVGGMIQYLPVEESFAEGKDAYLINCIWVHGHKEGRGNFQKRGYGTALLEAAEGDARALGAKGIAAWGLLLPFWMKASWFRKHGYRAVGRMGIQSLVWKPFVAGGGAAEMGQAKRKPVPEPGKVVVTAFLNGWCPAQNLSFERAKRAAAEFGSKVEFREIKTSDRQVLLEWGISDAIYIDGKLVRTGPPPSYGKLKALIGRRVSRL